jgi:acyl-CoA synthetase (AMP-forming)/AMP-acid ligase II
MTVNQRAATADQGLLHDLLDAAVASHPRRPAVTAPDGAGTLDYAGLARASHRLAAWLTARGLGRGDRMVVCLPSSPLTAALVYAASRAGIVFVLLHEDTRPTSLAHVVADCEPRLLLAPAELARRTDGLPWADAAEMEHVLARADQPGEDDGAAVPPLAVDPVCLLYTSGSTAAPKAVVTTHQQLRFAVSAIQSVLRYRGEDVVYTPLPLSFDYGLYQLFLCATAGAHCRLGNAAQTGPAIVRTLRGCGATVLPAVPHVARTLARMAARSPEGLPALRLLTNTGAELPVQTTQALREALPGLTVQLMFGLTECKRATIMPPDGDLARPGSCGRALPGTEVFVVDKDGRRLPPGRSGELVVRGPHVMAGYWRRPELNAQRFPRVDGLFPELRTGDYGRLDAEGYLYFEGRRDDVYKAHGFRVSGLEVEAAARRVDGVEDAALLVPSGTAPAHLFVVGTVSADRVLVELRSLVEDFKVPDRCSTVARLPLTRNGKVDRAALAAWGAAAPAHAGGTDD